MIKEKVIILNKQGLDSRPAIAFLKLINKFKSDVILVKNNNEYNGKSILGILSMSATKNDEIEVVVNGEDEDIAIKDIIEFFENLRD